MKQLNLFEWAETRPSNVINAVPALIRKAALETVYQIPRPNGEGKVIQIGKAAA
ncbi:hypothetical protein [Phyllobacterium brassicacearum]|uniref:hypothetical protein n=1 Tax=Phyllobacterium brassicacearum TaxID=314235 RepID=UPI0010D7A9D1|nr:hypothetical protein [Phyllobacterium brassicacearum]TDQ19895.1 hypothetical protein DEV91_12490 [Phyllobacterium brassicacearum]